MNRSWTQINWYLTLICSSAMAIAMVAAFSEVVARYLFNGSLIGVVETVTLALPFIIFLPLAYVEMQESHIRANLFVGHLPHKWQVFFDLIGSMFSLVLFILFTWLSWEMAIESWQSDEVFTGILELPVYWTRFAIALGFLLAMIQVVISIFRHIRALIK